MNGKQILEMLARLPARVWLQAILGLIGLLGFAGCATTSSRSPGVVLRVSTILTFVPLTAST